MCAWARTRAAHAHTLAHVHTHYLLTHARISTQTLAHIHPHRPPCTHTVKRTPTQALTHTHAHIRGPANTHARTHTHTHTHTNTNTHTVTRAHTHSNTTHNTTQVDTTSNTDLVAVWTDEEAGQQFLACYADKDDAHNTYILNHIHIRIHRVTKHTDNTPTREKTRAHPLAKSEQTRTHAYISGP